MAKARQARADPSSREAIHDAAERVFAAYGYEGAGMRRIAEEAGVAQALLHYHFGTKERLFEAILERRSSRSNARRESLLDALFRDDAAPPSLEEVVGVMMLPPALSDDGDASDLNVFRQIVAALSVASDERSEALILRFYDAIASRFIEALRRVRPELTREAATWAYLFALGVRVQGYASNNRAVRLNGPGGTTASPDELMVAFVTAGIEALGARAAASGPIDRPVGLGFIAGVGEGGIGAAKIPDRAEARREDKQERGRRHGTPRVARRGGADA